MRKKKTVLLILDGWGYGKQDESNAIFCSKTPFFNQLMANYPHSKLKASGEAVGLPAGQMGNSEVGHINLGAGRVVYQELGRINKAIADYELANNSALKHAFDYAKNQSKKVHLIGLLSDGGVHAHINHVKALCDVAQAASLENIFIHAFLDGRDTDPNAGVHFVETLEAHLLQSNAKIASVIGRYYAMDRDNRWERIKQAYDLMVHGIGSPSTNMISSIQKSYAAGITDEFILPIIRVNAFGEPLALIQEGDVVISFNFRTDRVREMTIALTQKDVPAYDIKPLSLYYLTMTNYDHTFNNVHVLFNKENLSNTLGEVLERHNKKQVRIAETEKYPHVTFFFSGGREKKFVNEKRILIPSPKVATYDLEPAMSAQKIANAVCEKLSLDDGPDFVCLNFANPDMVGHTGFFSAVVQAIETVDRCLEQVVTCGIAHGYSFIILADHGNADYMINDDGSANTSHTTNLVPCILIDQDHKQIKNGKLSDIAPTLLTLMDIPIPEIMDGHVLTSV